MVISTAYISNETSDVLYPTKETAAVMEGISILDVRMVYVLKHDDGDYMYHSASIDSIKSYISTCRNRATDEDMTTVKLGPGLEGLDIS